MSSSLPDWSSDVAGRHLLEHRHNSGFTKASAALNLSVPCQGIHPHWQGQNKMQNAMSTPTVQCLCIFLELPLGQYGHPLVWQESTTYEKDQLHEACGILLNPFTPQLILTEAIFPSLLSATPLSMAFLGLLLQSLSISRKMHESLKEKKVFFSLTTLRFFFFSCLCCG